MLNAIKEYIRRKIMDGYIRDNNKNFIKLNRCLMENWLWTKKAIF